MKLESRIAFELHRACIAVTQEYRSMDNEALMAVVSRVFDQLRALPMEDQRLVSSFVWIVVANNARMEALAFPDGFPREQAKQIEELEQMAEMVRTDEPDLEVARLVEEGDMDGLVRLMRDRGQSGAGESRPDEG